ncbi:phenoloxidase-activating factor 2-like isoform X2 [Macrobrachium rosenbergii]
MRLLAFALGVLMTAAQVRCQSDTRLGLISSQLGVPPVPGSPFAPTPRPNNQPSGCFCLPSNQVCPGNLGNPGPGVPNTSGAGVFDVRIVNRRPQACNEPGSNVCCLGNANPSGNLITNPPVRPNPVIPNPHQIGGTCGVQNPVPYRQAQYPEADFGEYPWTAVILDFENRYLGGGVLIAADWVLTAAHKIDTYNNIKVRLGELDVKSPQDHPQYPHVEVIVDNVIIHPNFNSQNLANDVALLHLSRPVDLGKYPHIGTACLPEQGQVFYGQSCWVTGWGKDAFEDSGSFQNVLKEVDVPMVDPFVCENRLRRSRLGPTFVLDKDSFVCAGGIEGKDACTGDGGAPLVCLSNRGWTVSGLVAWGIGCAGNDLPGVYVNVANYVNYIRQYVR